MGKLLKQYLRAGEQRTESVPQGEVMALEKLIENPPKRRENKAKTVGVHSDR